MVSLDYDSYSHKPVFTKAINCVRVRNVPLVNFVIIGVLGFFLLKLTTKYTGLYMKNSLITIIVTNLVLFGISETLAQTLLCYKANAPIISLIFDNNTRDFLSFNSNDILTDGTFPNNEVDDLERFVDYIDNESTHEDVALNDYDGNPLHNPIELSYFKFSRLAGFMVWGFIMAFCQCWWYKFLQIYSKDPKFIEVLRKVLTDQLFYSPISLFCFFTYGTIVLENGTWDDTKEKLRRIYLKTLIVNYSVWFPVQFINFLLVPRSFQVPFSSSISVLWNCFLSMRNSTN